MAGETVGRDGRRGITKRLNERLYQAAQRYYETLGEAVRAAADAVQASGLYWPDAECRPLGYEKGDRYTLDCGGGVTVVVALYRLQSGRYELTAYAS